MSYLKKITMQLKNEDYVTIEGFAEDTHMDNWRYYQIKQPDLTPIKVKNDIIIGKAIEVAFYKAAGIFGLKLNAPPDFKIYSPEDRSYMSDFFGVGDNAKEKYLVKGSYDQTWRHNEEHTYSWTFNAWDHCLTRSCNNDYMVLGVFNSTTGVVDLYGVVQAEALRKKDLFKNPKSKKYIDIKRCIYLSDIRDSGLTHSQMWSKLLRSGS